MSYYSNNREKEKEF